MGSIASLSSLEAISVNPKLRSHGSSSGLNSMNNPGDRRSYQEPLQLVLDSSGQGGAAAAAPAGGKFGASATVADVFGKWGVSTR